jgi:hypothetical protein
LFCTIFRFIVTTHNSLYFTVSTVIHTASHCYPVFQTFDIVKHNA